MEAGSAAKVVDCVLSLKSYYEWKQMSNGNGFTKYVKSPLVMVSANRLHSRASTVVPSDSCRHLDMSAVCERQPPVEGDNQKVEGFIDFSFLRTLYMEFSLYPYPDWKLLTEIT
ncbi:hypothetical protein C1H46_045365 [Malus baccata]|uniref:Uncharacterized protein n=1 Tax=Malus baccata TaxID=106549 RepID=A0A540K5E3_MALBA|nr:hypothetical protein C1H46_045365 [Malus baccata]